MGQQLADSAIALRRQAGQHIFQIGIRIVPIELGTLDQTHDPKFLSYPVAGMSGCAKFDGISVG
jgi:hypothetical protein